jgi:hypothetical protein
VGRHPAAGWRCSVRASSHARRVERREPSQSVFPAPKTRAPGSPLPEARGELVSWRGTGAHSRWPSAAPERAELTSSDGTGGHHDSKRLLRRAATSLSREGTVGRRDRPGRESAGNHLPRMGEEASRGGARTSWKGTPRSPREHGQALARARAPYRDGGWSSRAMAGAFPRESASAHRDGSRRPPFGEDCDLEKTATAVAVLTNAVAVLMTGIGDKPTPIGALSTALGAYSTPVAKLMSPATSQRMPFGALTTRAGALTMGVAVPPTGATAPPNRIGRLSTVAGIATTAVGAFRMGFGEHPTRIGAFTTRIGVFSACAGGKTTRSSRRAAPLGGFAIRRGGSGDGVSDGPPGARRHGRRAHARRASRGRAPSSRYTGLRRKRWPRPAEGPNTRWTRIHAAASRRLDVRAVTPDGGSHEIDRRRAHGRGQDGPQDARRQDDAHGCRCHAGDREGPVRVAPQLLVQLGG